METCKTPKPTLPSSEALDRLTSAVQSALSWRPEEADLPRKVAAVRSLARSFSSCLEQTFESDYGKDVLDEAAQLNPSLARSVAALKSQRESLRWESARLVRQLEGSTAAQPENFMILCEQLRRYLGRHAAYSHVETKLIQEAYNQDSGGEA